MRIHKDTDSPMSFGQALKYIKPIINIAVSSILVFIFLVISYKLILGEGNDTAAVFQVQKNKNVDKAIEKVADAPNPEAGENTEGMSGIKVSDISITNVKVYLSEEKRTVELPLEEYIKGVVASEMPLNFSKEALKAQAVAARTYTASHMKDIGGGCSKANGADLCDTVHCQVYTPKEKKINDLGALGEERWAVVEEVVEETKGMVMSYKGDLVTNAFYFSTSGGKTENVEDVFSKSLPYLKSVDSPGEEAAPRYTSSKNIDLARFAEIINNAYADAGVVPYDLPSQVNILSHTDGGCVKEIQLGGVTITGVNFRKLFGLNSANFNFEFLDNEVVIDCTGFGHGVGMSQWGANVMAQGGSTYEEILKHYYTGVEIETLNNN